MIKHKNIIFYFVLQSFLDENHHLISKRRTRSRRIRVIIIVSTILIINVALVVAILTGSDHTGKELEVSHCKYNAMRRLWGVNAFVAYGGWAPRNMGAGPFDPKPK